MTWEKAELRMADHLAMPPGHHICEVWWRGEFVASIYGADAAGVRVISKHPLSVKDEQQLSGSPVHVVEVLVDR